MIRFALQAVSEIQGRQNSEMHRMTLTDFEHLEVKNTLYTPNTYPRGPNLGPFRSATSGFQDMALFTIPH